MNELPTFSTSTANTMAYSMHNLTKPISTTSRTGTEVFYNEAPTGFNRGLVATVLQNSIPNRNNSMARRLVKIYVSDPNPSIPLDDCILYRSDEILTEATDQELFFELDVHNMLKKHNEKRTKILDKNKNNVHACKLEPARIRDLKMTVETIADL